MFKITEFGLEILQCGSHYRDATEMQNNFGRYLSIVQAGSEVIVTRNGKEVGRFIPKDHAVSYLTDTLTGILHGSEDMGRAKEERLREKYAAID